MELGYIGIDIKNDLNNKFSNVFIEKDLYFKTLNREIEWKELILVQTYKKICNCYYILKSEFDRITKTGILLCQVLRNKNYYKHGMSNSGYFGVGESILMRNGYNVKASHGFSDIQRKMILKNIMDNNIMQLHKIASYIKL